MKIFLVEDSPDILHRLYTLVAETGGMTVVGQADGQERALAGIFSKLPEVVILDLSLTSGSGIVVLQQVKLHHPEICIIVLTNNSYPQYREKCRLLGAEHFLDKTRDFATLGGLLTALAGAEKSCEAA
jgi:two-component system chemotaxis response regulator CheY